MKKVDGFTGKKFLAIVLVAYFFTFFFSYSYFMIANPIILGKVISNYSDNDSYLQDDKPILIKTFSILGILFLVFVFAYIVPKILHKRQMKRKGVKIIKYSPFRNQ